MCFTIRLLFSTFFLTKKISNSMCLVLAWRTGLWDRATELRVSHRTSGVVNEIFNSASKASRHRTSTAVLARLIYSCLSAGTCYKRPWLRKRWRRLQNIWVEDAPGAPEGMWATFAETLESPSCFFVLRSRRALDSTSAIVQCDGQLNRTDIKELSSSGKP